MASLVDEVVQTTAFLATARATLSEAHAQQSADAHAAALCAKISAAPRVSMDEASQLLRHIQDGTWTAPRWWYLR